MEIIQETAEIAQWMYRKGWDERNGGNISVWLTEADCPQAAGEQALRSWQMEVQDPKLWGARFLVTGSGKYFRKIQGDEEKNLGIVRIAEGGERLELLWGLADGGAPTSELATHLRCHAVRRRADPAHRVIMHCHPEHLIAMSYVHSLDERELTRSLWRMGTECLVVFPEGIGALPWMVCGGEEIARASAEKMADCRLLLWAHHGVFGAGETLDETYGLIETAEKAAEIYLKIAPFEVLQTITDEKLAVLGEAFGVCPRAGYLEEAEEELQRAMG